MKIIIALKHYSIKKHSLNIMDKLWLIIKREYLTRVKTKAFIFTTLLTPIGMAAFLAIVVLIFSYDGDSQRIVLKDDSGIFAEKSIKDSERAKFFIRTESLDELLETYKEKNYNGVIHIPAKAATPGDEVSVTYHSDEQISATTKSFIESKMASRIKDFKIEQSGYDKKKIEAFATSVRVKEKGTSGEAKDKGDRASIATALSLIIGSIMFMVITIYGQMVMRSVMEEKVSRIVEVMISSIKPFQLMMGKLIGVGGVGLTQLLAWAVLIPGLIFLVSLIMPFIMDPPNIDMGGVGTEMDMEDMENRGIQFLQTVGEMNWWQILPIAILCFLGGYFIYSALYAAIGSAIGDDLGEGQSFAIPISILQGLAFYITIAVVQNPNSPMAVWSSMIPFFAPMVLPARMAFDPPLIQIFFSLLILFASSVLLVWLSARIYRVGILMYGKKVTARELWKWIFYRG